MFALAGLALCALPDYMESFDRNGIAQYQKVGADRKSLTTFLGPARREFSHKLGPAAEARSFFVQRAATVAIEPDALEAAR
jgi:hypothetical protein